MEYNVRLVLLVVSAGEKICEKRRLDFVDFGFFREDWLMDYGTLFSVVGG